MDFQYILATDLDRAWLNFELDLPLQPGPKGETNPFYVDRPGNPTARLERELLRQYSQTPKVKLEPITRSELRQVFERNLYELVSVIDKIAMAIFAREKRPPLVLIDDLDKPDLKQSDEIFYQHWESMLQPKCPIAYVVASPLFYSPEFQAIRDRAIFLPNIKLHEQVKPDVLDPEGYKTMRMFVRKRLHPDLITEEALNAAIAISGGVFREMARIMRGAIGQIQIGHQTQINIEHIRRVEAEIRGEYRRFLTKEHRVVLRAIRAHNRYDEPDKVAPLLQMLAALEYSNGEPWCEVHPVLNKLLDEDK